MPLSYKPAADSRHRRACLALYRALVRQGRQIRLPDDLLDTTQLKPRNGDSNPITTVINNTFHRNRKDTSMRLVSLALKNGYKFLDLLSRAAQESTSTTASNNPPHGPIYTSILTFLRENRTRVTIYLSTRAAHEASIARLNTPHPSATPILTLLPPTDENPGPVYVPTARPRPLSSLSGGVRKIPTLMACGGFPILKFGMPQTPIMSGIIRSNSRRRQIRVGRLSEMQEMDAWMGRMEDEWEGLVDVMLAEAEGEADLEEVLDEMESKRRREWKYGRSGTKTQVQDESWWVGKERRDWSEVDNLSYEESWHISIDELRASLRTQQDHWVAKGKAMWQIVVDEREFAEKEAKERGTRLDRPVSSFYLDKVKDWRRTWERRQVKERVKKMYEAEERGDHETARRIAEEEFKVRPPKRPGFRKEDMIRAM